MRTTKLPVKKFKLSVIVEATLGDLSFMYDKANFDCPSVVPSSLLALTASKSINDLFTVKVYRKYFVLRLSSQLQLSNANFLRFLILEVRLKVFLFVYLVP